MQPKRYSKTELALMYFPDSSPETARRHLMSWITSNPELMECLRREHYDRNSRIFTKRQVQLIFDYLDDP